LHPDYLLERLTRKQINEWYAYATVEPVGNPTKDVDEDKVRKQKQGMYRSFFKTMKDKFNGS